MTNQFSLLFFFFLIAVSFFPGNCHGDDFVAASKQLAPRIPFLNTLDVLYDRYLSQRQINFSAEEIRAYEELVSLTSDVDPQQISAALTDRDPLVRTIGIVAAYHADAPAKWLPEIYKLVDDPGNSFSSLVNLDSGLMLQKIDAWNSDQRKPQAVGVFATAILQEYLRAAGYQHGIEGLENGDGKQIKPGFNQYMADRKNLEYCPSWFKVELARASNQSSVVENEGHVLAVRERILSVPNTDRDWILLSLAAPWEHGTTLSGGNILADEKDLVDRLRELDPDHLIKFLTREPFSDHLEFRFGNETGSQAMDMERMTRFILKHANSFFDKQHAEMFLEIGNGNQQTREKGLVVTKRWIVAAVDLDPALAERHLQAALSGFAAEDSHDEQDENVIVARAMCKYLGATAIPELLDWFFEQSPDRGAIGFGRHRFCQDLGKRENLELTRALLVDPRLEQLDPMTIRFLVIAVNKLADEPVVNNIDLDNAWHPFGLGPYHFQKEKANREFPAETEQLESRLASWRDALVEFASR